MAGGLRDYQMKQKSQANHLTFRSDIIRSRMASPDGVILCWIIFTIDVWQWSITIIKVQSIEITLKNNRWEANSWLATTFNFIKAHLQRLKKAFSSFAGLCSCSWLGERLQTASLNKRHEQLFKQSATCIIVFYFFMCFYFLTTTPSFIRFHFKTTIFICLH